MTKLKDFKNEIKVLDVAALISRAKVLKVEIADLVLDLNINKLKDKKAISKKKKELARVLTVLTQKEMIGKLEPKAPEVKEEKEKPEKGGKK